MPDRTPILTVAGPSYGGLFSAGAAAAGEPDGTGLAHVLPGEQVRVEPNGQLTVLQASPDRVKPVCIHFGACGGCHYQHARYPAQLAWKRQILEGLLGPLASLPDIQQHPSPPWQYRNRIRLRVQVTAEAVELGYSRWRSNEFLAVQMCPIAAPVLWQAAGALVEIAAADPRVRRWLGAVSALELFTDGEQTQLQVLFLVAEPGPARRDPSPARRDPGPACRDAGALAHLAACLEARVPQLAGAGTEVDPEAPRRVRQAFVPETWRRPGLLYPVAGRRYWVPRGAFFQVNRFLLPDLLAAVVAGAPEPLAWDLFAGVGLFAQALAAQGAEVVAVEGAPRAAEALLAASRTQPTLEAVHAATLDFLRAGQTRRERPRLIVLDPPRAGLGAEASELVARLRPARIAYVSCDPTTLARDLATLLQAGYRIEELHLFDLFPQTFHLESVVKLRLPGENADESGGT